ncbi:3-hydroxyanthranilate 3,4-dioxygenase [Flagellimonas maritima]|uniref:3-hydroxyanthranilate 3,4-dioxygenase n=2 Tax=Flagellimonas maritima TaxID=1383885 RepID=A0A2Z4LRI8_9FLAO|nr:3-hydroxyanthranilate 3,4-dioxygenase [Allomuricauda aurantiaca]
MPPRFFIPFLKSLKMAIRPPFNLNKWVEENRDSLKPPVGNKNIYQEAGDYIVMIVAGPNARKDYHYNETEELFYQLEGNIEVHIQENGQKKTMKLGPGDMYLHPAKVPHSPVRHKDSIGLVVERKRADMNVDDGLLWFCDSCNNKLYEAYFTLHDIEKDFLSHFEHFYSSEELRTCNNCGTVMPVDERYIAKD